MKLEEYISVSDLCQFYEMEISFFKELTEHGFIEMITIKESNFLHQDQIPDLEKIIRFYQDLGVNWEGIEVALNLLTRIEDLQKELNYLHNKLKLYENL